MDRALPQVGDPQIATIDRDVEITEPGLADTPERLRVVVCSVVVADAAVGIGEGSGRRFEHESLRRDEVEGGHERAVTTAHVEPPDALRTKTRMAADHRRVPDETRRALVAQTPRRPDLGLCGDVGRRGRRGERGRLHDPTCREVRRRSTTQTHGCDGDVVVAVVPRHLEAEVDVASAE